MEAEKKVRIRVFDTQENSSKLIEVIKSLDNRSECRIDSWWTVVREDDEIPDTFYISQTNGEIGGYNPGRARVVENQIWCGSYKEKIARALEERDIHYNWADVDLLLNILCGERAEPLRNHPNLNRTY